MALVGKWVLTLNDGDWRMMEVEEKDWKDENSNSWWFNPVVDWELTCVRFTWEDGTVNYFPLSSIKVATYKPYEGSTD